MFSQDEIVALIFSAVLASQFWLTFAQRCVTCPYRMPLAPRGLLLGSLALAVVLLYYVLVRWSSYDVRSNHFYIAFYMIIGAAWLGLGRKLLNLLDLRTEDDVLARGNLASGWACSGALLGLMACFAGGNVGDGPGWWAVLYSSALATGAALLAWMILVATTRLADAISIERDVAAGLRAAGFWIGAGMILRRAAAGNWISLEATNRDFLHDAWPVLLLLAVAIIVEWLTQPRAIPSRLPFLVRGILPTAIYIGAGVASLILLGAP